MKVFEKDLVIGDEYWMDKSKEFKGFFVGTFENDGGYYCSFYAECDNPFFKDEDGTIGFRIDEDNDFWYEEV